MVLPFLVSLDGLEALEQSMRNVFCFEGTVYASEEFEDELERPGILEMPDPEAVCCRFLFVFVGIVRLINGTDRLLVTHGMSKILVALFFNLWYSLFSMALINRMAAIN